MTAEGAHARALEAHTRRLLAEHAATVAPGDGLPAIRARIRRPWWRRALAHLTASKTAARGATRAAAKPNDCLESKDMTTIISRRARDLHAGDVITHDPDHDRPVRWRVSRPAVRTRDGEYALTTVTDQATGEEHVTYYRALQTLTVEPAGGAQ